MSNHGGARKNAGRKKGIGITYDIQRYCEIFINQILKDEAIRNKAIKQLELNLESNMESVYVIESNGNYKIGFSSNFKKRIKSYKTHLPDFNVVINVECDNAFNIESFLHDEFSECRLKGEWFYLDQTDLVKCLSIINKMAYGW